MSVILYTENWNGKFKKLSFELCSYGFEIAKNLNVPLVAVSIGNVAADELAKLGTYGVSKILTFDSPDVAVLDNRVYTAVIAEAAKAENAKVVVLANTLSGKALAPRLSVHLKAGLVGGAMALPESYEPFIVSKKAFTGNALAKVQIKTAVKIVTLTQNAYQINENPVQPAVTAFAPASISGLASTQLKESNMYSGKVLLTDAEIIVSGGRGMRGPENWAPIEELADLLGAGTACSRPVSDEGWRPHAEHVGQTGKVVAPNLYFAIGISGAIQHIAGVSGSKFIVAINKDPEAPVFQTANYGVIGDAQQILPELVKAVKEFKSGQ
ncbi:MAG: electron transfer flavoprotein subunit alpha/FixB family protein [Bacteroidota bacterium]